VGVKALPALALLIASGAVPASAAPLVAEVAPGVTVDWTRAIVTARGVGPADRNAPSPAVARVGARRAAISGARARLLAAVGSLPAVGGSLGTVADATRLATEVEAAPVVDEQLGTDGSVRVTIAVGTEALRLAITGPRPAPADEAAPETWIVDARDQPSTVPVIGLALAHGVDRAAFAIRYATTIPSAPGATSVRATAARAGQLDLDGALPPAGAAVVVVVRPDP